MRALFIHAHFDDYEFSSAGTFEQWRRLQGRDFRAKVIVCTDGKAGHHRLTREETGQIRLDEQRASAGIGGYEFEPLQLPDGSMPREACMELGAPLMAALWKVIRDFEPDYLFCPPLPTDPNAGVHVDHLTVAEAIRRVAYMINVPHAFAPEYPDDETQSEPCKVPVILTVYDGYMFGSNAFDLAVDVAQTFDLLAEMSWCHQSQVTEWLPWVGRHDMPVPKSMDDWRTILRNRFEKRNHELGLGDHPMAEVFTVTGWGVLPTLQQLKDDLPGLIPLADHEVRLDQRLTQWRL